MLGTLLLPLQGQPLPLLLPLPLPLALLLEGPGGEDQEPSSETREGDWLGSSQASWSLGWRSRANLPSLMLPSPPLSWILVRTPTPSPRPPGRRWRVDLTTPPPPPSLTPAP